MEELVVITGGAGFIGSHLAEAFVRDGYRVRVIDNLSTGKSANLARIRDSIDFRKIDVCDLASLIPALEGASIIQRRAHGTGPAVREAAAIATRGAGAKTVEAAVPVVRRINSQESSQLLSCVVTIRRPDICEKPCCNLLQPRLGRSSCSAS